MSREGKFWKVDPATGMRHTPPEACHTGGGDHRGMTFGPDGALYTLSHNAPRMASSLAKERRAQREHGPRSSTEPSIRRVLPISISSCAGSS